MRARDFALLTAGTLRAHGLRSALAILGIAVGITAVILLTSIGQGVREFVLSQFMRFGSNLILVSPGRVETAGVTIGIFGTVRPLTIDDAIALRRAPHVLVTNPVTDGNAEIHYGGRSRRVIVYGFSPAWAKIWNFRMAAGSYLPEDDPQAPRAFAVLGSKAKQELFGNENAIGKRIEISGSRYRVIGVVEPQDRVLGIDINDSVTIPTARALELFNRDGLTGIHVTYDPDVPPERVVEGLRRVMTSRHGRDDVTFITQDEMVRVLDSVLGVLTFAVGALGSISLLVGGVGILTIMTIAVTERTAEIGLLRALGGGRGQILRLFLGEAAMLAAVGGAAGLLLGAGIAQAVSLAIPALPVSTPWWFAFLALGMSIGVGLVAGVVPAIHAARLEPVEALRAE
ncbi:MAG TPA: ABC transporter permease [Thermoanaerobaculia bacterium]|nr:ABC transporter permease [Thermoanaerobaculia bacterium]